MSRMMPVRLYLLQPISKIIDNDGKLDHLKLEFSEAIDDSTINAYNASANYTPTSLALANVTGEAIDASEPNGDVEDNSTLYIIFDENTGACSSADQTGCDTELTNQDITFTGASVTIDDLATGFDANNYVANVVTATITEIDLVGPVLMKVVAGTSSGANTIAFTFSEPMTACNGASTTTCGNLTSVGTIAGLGNFGTNGNIKVPTLKNTVAGTGTDTITVTLAGQSGGYLQSTDVGGPDCAIRYNSSQCHQRCY